MNATAFFQDLAVLMAVVGLVSIVFTRLHWPKVIGYLLAGILMSQYTWGGSFLVDANSISTIGQLGIVFLMFALGLEFSAGDMRKVQHVAVPTALLDVIVMIWLGYFVGTRFLGWSKVQSLFLGAAICDSATTLLAKTIDDMKWSSRPFVRFIFGTTIFEDVLCVGVIALVTGIASGGGMSVLAIGRSLGELAVFLIGVMVFGLLIVPRLLDSVGELQDDETLLLTMLGGCFLVSFIALRLDFSLALGAFLVGILGSSAEVRRRLHELVVPLRTMFAAVFFVTIGLLVNPSVCWHHIGAILGLSLVVMGGKALNCFVGSILTGQKVKDAVQTGLGLAQIGEFAYMVALLYLQRVNDPANPMYQIVVGVSLLTTCLNPLMLKLSDPVGDWCERHQPERLRRLLAAYGTWLERYRTGNAPSVVQRQIRASALFLVVCWVLILAVFISCALLNGLDYSRFGAFFEAHKRLFYYLAANLFALATLAPVVALALSLGRGAGQVIAGSRLAENGHAEPIIRLVRVFVLLVVLAISFAEVALLNVNLAPDDVFTRVVTTLIFVFVGVFGWNRFHAASRRAGRHFVEVLAADRRRERESARAATAIRSGIPAEAGAWIVVPAGSAAIGGTLRSLDLRAKTGATVVAVERAGAVSRNPGPDWAIAPGDVLAALGDAAQIAALRNLLS